MLIEKSINEKDDYQQEYQTSSTYAASKLNFVDSKEPRSLNELNFSSISSIDNKEFSLDLFSQIDFLNDMPVSPDNNNNYYSSEYFMSNFTKVIKDTNQFDYLMKQFQINPVLFIQNYFSLLVSNGVEISMGHISHLLLIKSFPLYSSIQTEVFYFQVIKKYFNILSSNYYGTIVISQLINYIALDQNLLFDFMELIKANLFAIVSSGISIKLIETLLNLNHYCISNIISDVILSNTLHIALSPNGPSIIGILIQRFLRISNRIIQVLLNNIRVLSNHCNGYLIIELLYCLNNPQIGILVSKCILANISFLIDKGYYLHLIEKWIPYFNPVIQAEISAMRYDKAIIPHFKIEQKGIKFKGKTPLFLSENVSYFRKQIRKQTR